MNLPVILMEFTSYIGGQWQRIPRLCCASWRTFCSEASWLNFCHFNKVFISNFSSRMEAVNKLDRSLSRHEGVSWRRLSSFPLLSHRGEPSWYESMNQIRLVIMKFEGLKVVLQETFDNMLGWALLESTLKVVTPTSQSPRDFDDYVWINKTTKNVAVKHFLADMAMWL